MKGFRLFDDYVIYQYRCILSWFIPRRSSHFYTQPSKPVKLGKLSIPGLLLLFFAGYSTALAGTFTVFGPETIKIVNDRHDAIELAFSIDDPTLSYELRVSSGKLLKETHKKSHEDFDDDDDKDKRNKSKLIANIVINELDIVGPNYFSDSTTEYTGDVQLQQNNKITISPQPNKGNYLTLEITGQSKEGKTFTAFGPITVTREKKDKLKVDSAFSVIDPTAVYEVQVSNGDQANKKHKKTRVKAFEISINDDKVIRKEDKRTKTEFIDSGVIQQNNIISIAARGKTGSYLTTQVVGYDETPPEITATIEPILTNIGSSTSAVLIKFHCYDKTSGIATCPEPVDVNVNAVEQKITATAVDKAGNTASTTISLLEDSITGAVNASITNQGTFTVFGPEKISRIKGRPKAAELAFAVKNPSLSYELRVTSGREQKQDRDDDDDDDDDDRDDKSKNKDKQDKDDSSDNDRGESDDDDDENRKLNANIVINGIDIIGPNYFNKTTTTYTGDVTLQNFNSIKIAPEKPSGSYLIVELVGRDANGQEFSVFGPITVIRSKEDVFSVRYNFQVLDPLANYELQVLNGAQSGERQNKTRVSSAKIRLNDALILRSKDFHKKTPKYVEPVTLQKENTISISLRGKPGTYLTSEIIGHDDVSPEITATVEPLPNQNGWNNTSVLVTFSCNDTTSGISFCSEPVKLELEGEGQKVVGTAKDHAGNQSITILTVNIDKTAPVIKPLIQPAPNVNGWNNTAVTVSFDCSDALSGIADCPEPITVETDGSNQLVSGSATDNAGNTATASVTLNIDKIKPIISYAVVPAPNQNGWNNSAVTVSFTCSDTLSGIADCPDPITVDTDGGNQLVSGTATDLAGNSATASLILNIDTTMPTISASAAPLANAAGWNNTDVTVSFHCTDTISGVAECTAPITVATEGANQQITGEVVDLAGNTATATVPISLDKTPPTITAIATTPANAAGWYNKDVTVRFECSDAISGIASCPEPVVVATEGEGQSISGTATDRAGNSAATSITLNIDKSTPSISIVSPPSGSALSVNPPQLSISYSDNTGVNPASLQLSLNGQTLQAECQTSATAAQCTPVSAFTSASVTVTASIQDFAGNSASAQATYSIDSDNDGVPDVSDQCPNTPVGEAADTQGCSASQRDSDGDGINDAVDQCPATPSGETIDNVGCSASQRDTDGDGVNDATDLCPGTGAGESVDGLGCSAAQNDLDGDGYPNDQDVFPTNPKEWADLDGDGVGDNSDPDIDGDGVPNESDAYPTDPTRFKLPTVTIDSPETLTTVGSSPIEITGTVDTAGVLTVNGETVTANGGLYSANVALEEGHNTIVTRLVTTDGVISTASISVSLDLTPPYVTVESHTQDQVVRTPTVAISGLVNDIVRGTVEDSQANVTVNGIQATISNRSYLAANVTLIEGENLIPIVASDQVGNSATKTLKLIYQPTIGKHLEIAGGQDQTALINDVLPQPLSVKVLDDNDQPVIDKNVVFRVIQGSGILGIDTDLIGRGVVVKTDATGIASTKYQLGQRSGTGNHKVRARVVGYDDEIIFYASATANIGDKLSVNSGNNQRGGTYQPLPAPFVVAVTDAGTNVVKGARVRFDVTEGGGHFENDSDTITVVTDSDGRASAHYTLGGIVGLDKQTITATLLDGPSDQNITAGFTATGFTPGNAGATSITGVVVDNQDNPIPGVTIRVDGTNRQAVADQNGQFKITEAPVGPVHLIADGSTATVDGEYPSLSYNLVTVSGVENPLSSPIYMVKLNLDNARYAGPTDVEITLPEVPGFKLEVPAGSVTFPDGSKEGYVSVTAVNANKVPMAPPNGMQPQFIVTIQPTGAKFDPPAPLTLPNVDGHTPGAQVEMFSYDHDLEEFVAIGLGTVSEDGTVVKTNPGVGVIKAGWHCGAQPGGDGCCSGPEECNDYCAKPNLGCNAGCSIDESKPLQEQTPGDCSTATCGGSEDDPSDTPKDMDQHDCKTPSCTDPSGYEDAPDQKPKDNPNDCVDEVCVGPPEPDDGEKPDPGNDCLICQGGSPANAADGGSCDDECGACVGGKCEITDPNKPKSSQTPKDCKILLCDGSSKDDPTDRPVCNDSCQDFNQSTCSCELKPAHAGVNYGLCSECGPNGEAKQRTSGSCTPKVCWTGECSPNGCVNQKPAPDYKVSTCYQCVNGELVSTDDPLCSDDPCEGFSEPCKQCTVVNGKAVITNVDGPVPGNPCALCSNGQTINNAAGVCSDGDECTTGDQCINQACVATGINPICNEDDDDLGDITIRLTMFIPIDHIIMPDRLWLGDEIFTGDNRTFVGDNFTYHDELGKPPPQPDQGVAYRMAQQFTYRPGQGIVDEDHLSGLTERFDRDTSMTSIVGGKPDTCYRKSCPQCTDYDSLIYGSGPMHVENSCITTEARRDTVPGEPKKEEWAYASLSTLDVSIVEQSETRVKLLMEGDPRNSIVPGVPVRLTASITWRIYVEFNLADGKVTSWRIYGAEANNAAHDGFPAYELHVNKKVVHEYDPIASGKNPLALVTDWDESIRLDISGTP